MKAENERGIDLLDLGKHKLYLPSITCTFGLFTRIAFQIDCYKGSHVLELGFKGSQIRNLVVIELPENEFGFPCSRKKELAQSSSSDTRCEMFSIAGTKFAPTSSVFSFFCKSLSTTVEQLTKKPTLFSRFSKRLTPL